MGIYFSLISLGGWCQYFVGLEFIVPCLYVWQVLLFVVLKDVETS